ncbi:MAG TPA: cytochrome c [Chitinophagaceae bacterium]|nr:cytochrome c [Chitinophagaceae bacterium]
MRNSLILLLCISVTLWVPLSGCHHAGPNEPGTIYMPDMYYPRAFQAYSENPNFADNMTSRLPVTGTIKRGEMLPYHLPMSDSSYAYSGMMKDPLIPTDSALGAGKHLYLIYCAICHGQNLDGNGPLYKGGAGPFPAAPANFISGPKSTLPIGTEFYVATYGKNLMGSYSSQLSQTQRWEVVEYIQSIQQSDGATPSREDSTETTLVKAWQGTKPIIVKPNVKKK